jgi:GTP-binding protein
MPQTRFVTSKAFARGLNPIVVVNKIDRPARARLGRDQVFDLFDRLGASDEQLDFPIVYTSALNGIAGLDRTKHGEDMTPLFETIVEHCAAAAVDPDGPFQLQISRAGLLELCRRHRYRAHPARGMVAAERAGGGGQARRRQAQRPRAAA